MTRTMKLAATALLVCSIALAATACGSENEASSGADKSGASAVTGSSDTSVPVVGGPKPQSTAATDESTGEATSSSGDKTCGPTKGPDGALQIHIVAGDLSCSSAKDIAKQYGPLIATGAPQTVSGWDCGPSTTVGELARCTKGGQAFALMPN
ncbi:MULTISPECIES: hypothetical protein [Gordonia]|uniref:Secreted protein n=1 Tax=Gordonia sihwensis NBRC 108236 TaxID=1223544 RepID=L7LPS8_9ACTN|nr:MULTISPECIES: hypothetical protein [Gordonia]AUH67245.1 hypothetical protein CXX93_01260 [Gordonia sp. YC-JH1]KJR06723.1 hypothetical protein UG54_12900 [Gordonia sihwensis]KXT58371.1 hypothetical protein Y710_02300 [Gordonia sp. QH-12]MBY4568960.1 hypothetical protein [Gordonia sihwensis]GAC62043.1 hypothetical protein GSI01S_28_00120 [Gordonia sihwensis NBRC 108236]